MLVLILLEGNWLVKSDHDARSDGRADHHLLTGVMAALISGKKKLISGKQCKIETGAHHKNCTLAGLTLSHFHINNKRSICDFSTWLFSHCRSIQIAWHISILCQFITLSDFNLSQNIDKILKIMTEQGFKTRSCNESRPPLFGQRG